MRGRLVGKLLACLSAAWLGLGSGAALAQEKLKDDPPFVSLSMGAFDFLQNDDKAVDFRVEYRHSRIWFFKPWLGFEATSDGSTYLAGGVMFDIYFGRRIVLTPSFGAGWWRNGGGKDLGHPVEFRSQVELAYRFNDRSRLGVAISHLSNASLGDDNPGTEVLSFYYSIPLHKVFPPTP